MIIKLFPHLRGKIFSKNEIKYEVVSSRYERAVFTAEKVKTLLDLKIISGGAKLENGEIVVAPLD